MTGKSTRRYNESKSTFLALVNEMTSGAGKVTIDAVAEAAVFSLYRQQGKIRIQGLLPSYSLSPIGRAYGPEYFGVKTQVEGEARKTVYTLSGKSERGLLDQLREEESGVYMVRSERNRWVSPTEVKGGIHLVTDFTLSKIRNRQTFPHLMKMLEAPYEATVDIAANAQPYVTEVAKLRQQPV